MIEQILLLGIGLAAGAAVVWFFGYRKPSNNGMHDQLHNFQRTVAEHMDRMGQQMERRLQENVRAMNESKDFLANRVSAAERSVRSVSAGLGKLEQATVSLQRTSDEIAMFQRMLKNPKIRGSFGEVLLSNLLGEVLPRDRYELQYAYSTSGEVCDAVIKLQDGYIVAVDAKFPLANYELYISEQDGEHKTALRKAFMRDVKKHISDIAKKYVSPHDHTLDYAFMYIPSEGVYYETVVNDASGDGLWEFCIANHVIPVSPNSFLAYLQTVLIGLRGMKIEQQAREILQHLGQLRQDFGKFAEDFSTVGTHITNAKNRYDDSARRLDKFTNRMEQIETGTHVALPSAEEVDVVEERIKEPAG